MFGACSIALRAPRRYSMRDADLSIAVGVDAPGVRQKRGRI
jgi:hypothetical protein